MTALFPQGWISYLSIFMIFLRMLGWFLLAPVFSHRSVPMMIKINLALVVSFALFPVLTPYLRPVPLGAIDIAAYALRETAVGLLMGLVAFVTFEAIHLAFQYVGYQMGFGAVGLMDPVNRANVSVLVPFAGWIALTVFFFTDMHHHLIRLFVISFQVTASAEPSLIGNVSLLKLLMGQFAKLFVVAIKIAAPITLLVFSANTAVGILSRILPQMHVILFAFPVTILLGLATLYLLVPELIAFFENLFADMWADVVHMLKVF